MISWYTYYTMENRTHSKWEDPIIWILIISVPFFGAMQETYSDRPRSESKVVQEALIKQSSFKIAPRQLLNEQDSNLKQPYDIHALMQQASFGEETKDRNSPSLSFWASHDPERVYGESKNLVFDRGKARCFAPEFTLSEVEVGLSMTTWGIAEKWLLSLT